MSKLSEQIEAYQAGAFDSNPRPLIEDISVPDDVMVGRSLRLPGAVFDDLFDYAKAHNVPWSALARDWITKGLAAARAADGTEPDPAVDLHNIINHATHALRTIQQAPPKAAA
jgi:hypothetical protein